MILPEVIVMGGSWGGLQASLEILKVLPPDYAIPVVLVLHRLRTQEGNLADLLDRRLTISVTELEDKQQLTAGSVYVAPANYHVLLENGGTIALDDSEPENYSRPSIDVTFTSAADVYGNQAVGILLSGANNDGSSGLKSIFEKGGDAVVQDPLEAEITTMPLAAIAAVPGCKVQRLTEIQAYLLSLHVR